MPSVIRGVDEFDSLLSAVANQTGTSDNGSLDLGPLTIKWGTATTSGTSPSSVNIVFDRPFSSTAYSVVAVRADNTLPGAGTTTTIGAITNSGFIAYNNTGSALISWLAIGEK
ncbi:hypothetical protein NVP1052A_28 [Vibrio phage 1.052.A._10N.286.46.C3]|nr:hypothetical protein NVP1052A_28 [Vibrio phage 1.052.A._10N.286.46.C3]